MFNFQITAKASTICFTVNLGKYFVTKNEVTLSPLYHCKSHSVLSVHNAFSHLLNITISL
jgi:hypothetical protein